MQIADILAITQWWFYIFVIGIGFLPLTAALFHSFVDKGYIFAKIFGIVIVSYLVFTLGTLQLLPFTRLNVFIILLTCFILVYFLFIRQTARLTLRHGIFFLLEECLFFGGLLLWSYIRSFNPEIYGLEKYMDFGFLNSILRSTYFPPKDMWFTPESINYYYFGHFVTAILTRLTAIPSAVSYNLALATILGFCLTGSFSVAINLLSNSKKQPFFSTVKLTIAGILSAFLVSFSGNLHILYAFFKAYPNDKPVPLWELPLQIAQFPNNYWYPNATRFIYNTIHEFPMYSWVVSDLHGHVLDIMFVITTIALLLAFFLTALSKKTTNHPINTTASYFTFSYWKSLWYYLPVISFFLSVMYMTNAWDGMIYFLLTILVIGAIVISKNTEKNILHKGIQIAASSLVPLFVIFLGFLVFSLPFSMYFDPGAIVSGIGVLCAPEQLTKIGNIGPFLFEKDHCQKSPLWQLLILHGFFYFFVISFFVFLARAKKIVHSDIFVLLLIILASILINIPEFFYMKDIYPDHYRANTMFKLVFQSFIMLSLVSGYVIMRFIGIFKEIHTSRLPKIGLGVWMIGAWLLVSIVLIYPFLATNSFYGDLKVNKGLNGQNYLIDLHPEDYDAIMWLNQTIKGQPVILEAQGDSYTDYARISANTGLPTVLGWTVHEWLWRGSYDIPSPRITDIEKLYESDDLTETKSLLRKYNIAYVHLGNLEREKYESINEEKWEELGIRVFEKNGTVIYKLNEQ